MGSARTPRISLALNPGYLLRSALLADVREAMMRKSVPALNPDAYVRALDGWQRDCVEMLRKAVRKAAGFDEVIKWGHLVYLTNGPALLIRAEDARVLLGFWRGKRMTTIESRLKGGGKYELRTLEIREETAVSPAVVSRLAREAARLNHTVGNPTKDAAAVKTKASARRRPASRRRIAKASKARSRRSSSR
jgi:hypothetical protein